MDLSNPTSIASALVGQLGTSAKALVEFVAIYARLEHALKRVGRVEERNGRLEVQWARLIAAVEPHFQPSVSSPLFDAAVYIAKQPPKKQAIRNGRVVWTDVPSNRTDIALNTLYEHIRRTRNNLFHGGKYESAAIPDPARNQRLLESVTLVLCEVVRLSREHDEEVFYAFAE